MCSIYRFCKIAVLSTIACCFVLAGTRPTQALGWPDNTGSRVHALGRVALGIEDETTALTPLNHQNIAGLALLSKMNKLDIGFGHTSVCDTLSTSSEVREIVTSEIEFEPPGSGFHNLTYWLNDNFILHTGVETFHLATEITATPLNTPSRKGRADFLLAGGNADIVCKTSLGLAFGAGIRYHHASSQPDSLDSLFNLLGNDPLAPFGTTTSKLQISAVHLDWSLAAVYEINALFYEDNILIFGMHLHTDDDIPDLEYLLNLASRGEAPGPSTLGDYSVLMTVAGNRPGLGDVSHQYIYTPTPYVLSCEALCQVIHGLEAGLLLDYKISSVTCREEYFGYTPGARPNTGYKSADISLLGLTPVIQGKILLNKNTSILGGFKFSTWGSGRTDLYALNTLTEDINDTFKLQTENNSRCCIGIGLGLQAMGQQLQVGLEYQIEENQLHRTVYNENGGAVLQFNHNGDGVNTLAAETNLDTFRMGAEYWIIPFFALRAGYALEFFTLTDGHYNSSTNRWENLTRTGHCLSLGTGISLPQGLKLNFLVERETNIQNPKPESERTATRVYLDARIPI